MSAREKLEGYMQTRTTLDRGGWVQNDYSGPYGGYCLMGGLNRGFTGDVNRRVSSDVIAEVTEILRRYPSFRFHVWKSQLRGKSMYFPADYAITKWNDRWWRRASTVGRVIDKLIDKHQQSAAQEEIADLEGQRNELRHRIATLEEDKRHLQARVEILEAQNRSLLRRLADKSTLLADQRALSELDAELDAATEELRHLV